MHNAPARLQVELPTQSLALGAFDIHLDAERHQLTVVRREQPTRPVWQTVAGRSFLAFARDRRRFRFARGSFRIHHRIVESHPASAIDRVAQHEETVEFSGPLAGTGSRYTLRLTDLGNGVGITVETNTAAHAGATMRSRLTFALAPNAGIYGFGAQYSVLDLRGRLLPIWSQEQGHGRGLQPLSRWVNLFAPGSAGDWHTTYTAVPYFVTSDARSFAVDGYAYCEFDMRERGVVTVDHFAPRMAARAYDAGTPADVVRAHTQHCGRMPELPPWIHQGAVVRAGGGSAAVRQRLASLRRAGVPVAALWIEDWCGKRQTVTGSRLWWNWEPDADLYPDWPDLVAQLRDDGVRVLSYYNPFLVDAGRKPNHRDNLFAEAERRGLLVRTRRGRPYFIGQGGFRAALLDLSNPEARSWIEARMRAQLALGVGGWMNDFAEALPPDCVLHSGEDPLTFHNRYPEMWASVAREAVRNAGCEGDAVFFSRSGAMRSPAASTLFWLGDQTVTWDAHDGLASVVVGLLSSGLSGYALNHSDIGGYFSLNLPGLRYVRTPELYCRWAELAAFTTVFRTHDTNQPGANHQYDSDARTLAHFAAMARLYIALAPYRAAVVREATSTGLPVARHLLLHYPNDPEVIGLDRQFLLGSDVLVAPVLHPDHNRVRLYLPEGSWTHLWSGRTYDSDGQWIEVAAPIGQPAAFYRSDAAVAASLAPLRLPSSR